MANYKSWDYDKFDGLIKKAAPVDYERFRAQIWTESKFDPMAINPKSDARGLGQFLPSTFHDVMPNAPASDIFNPAMSIGAASKYMSMLISRFSAGKTESDDYNLALAGYNAGMKNVDIAIEKAGFKKGDEIEYSKVEPYLFTETRNYVSQINDIAEHSNMPRRAMIVDKMNSIINEGAKLVTGAQDVVDSGIDKAVDFVAVLGQFKNEPILIPVYIGLVGITALTGYFTIKAAFEGKSKGLVGGFAEGLKDSAALLENTVKTTRGILK